MGKIIVGSSKSEWSLSNIRFDNQIEVYQTNENIDLIKKMHLKTILVVKDEIGAINNTTLLNIEILKNKDLKLIKKYFSKKFEKIQHTVEGDLRRKISLDIKRLNDLGCYRGLRHRLLQV